MSRNSNPKIFFLINENRQKISNVLYFPETLKHLNQIFHALLNMFHFDEIYETSDQQSLSKIHCNSSDIFSHKMLLKHQKSLFLSHGLENLD